VVDRRDVFRAIHELTHAGIRATLRLMAARVVLRGMSSEMAAWCRNCQLCAHGKASPQHTATVQAIPIPERCFTHIYMDLVRPLPASLAEGFKYLFTMPATKPLSYAEAAGQPRLHTSRWHAAASVATVLGYLRGTGEGGQVFLVSSGWPRGDGQ
jgi:hypothetical protein